MSPEVFIKDLVSPALDIYSLGIICEQKGGREFLRSPSYLLWFGSGALFNESRK